MPSKLGKYTSRLLSYLRKDFLTEKDSLSLDDIAGEISKLKECMAALSAQKNALTSPIYKLPPEILGRIFYYVPYMAPMPAGRVLSTFGGLMAVVEVLNSLGVALASNPTSEPTTQKLGAAHQLRKLARPSTIGASQRTVPTGDPLIASTPQRC